MSHFFSIVTSAYNAQAFILYALESVKSQTEKDYEYIVVDNGSDDDTFEIVDKFAQQNPEMDIKLYHFDENLGISGGRNAGIKQAGGEYVCFLDADDYWCENKLEEVKKAIKNHPEYMAFCHWENHIKNGKSNIGEYRRVDNSDPYQDLLFRGNCLSTSAMAVKKDNIIKIGGFDTSLKNGEEDFDCWLRLAREGTKFFMIEKPLGVWTIRNDSISAKHIIHTEAVIAMLKMHFEYLYIISPDKNTVKKQQSKVTARNYCGCARSLSLGNERKEAKDMYFKALKFKKTYWKAYAGLILNMLHM